MTLKQLWAWAFTPEHVRAFNDWRRQPTTVAGISVVSGAVTGWASAQLTGRQALFAIVAGLVAIVLPDNANRKVSAVPAAVVSAQPFTSK